MVDAQNGQRAPASRYDARSSRKTKTQGGSTMDNELNDVFPRGGKNPYSQYFVGQSYLNMLSTEQVGVGNVTFEPGCRNNWHIHHADEGGGQILLVTGGRGWYQEWGKPARALEQGDVVNIPANVKHWHGAGADSWFCHLVVEVPAVNGSNEWCEPVSDEEYAAL
ncbi:cupin domain-containing protein [Gordonibacter massiliensis]|nr:cupin domain-containing protein [Gordonibacter massiliensis (ex Traore et al. 2017)]